MNEEIMQALDSIRNDEKEGDRERKYQVQEMMGEDFEKYFDVDEDRTLERDNNYLTDAKMGN